MSVIAVSDEYWMQKALELAAKAESEGEVPVGAVVVKGDELVGEGWNRPITTADPTAHAEIMALRDASQRLQNYRLPGCRLYVSLEPCTMCAGAIIHARIEKVIFATTEPKAGVVVSHACIFDEPQFNHRVTYQQGILADAAQQQLQSFFKRRRQESRDQKQKREQQREQQQQQ